MRRRLSPSLRDATSVPFGSLDAQPLSQVGRQTSGPVWQVEPLGRDAQEGASALAQGTGRAGPARQGFGEGAAGALGARGEYQGQWTVVRRRLAARSRANRPSCQGVR